MKTAFPFSLIIHLFILTLGIISMRQRQELPPRSLTEFISISVDASHGQGSNGKAEPTPAKPIRHLDASPSFKSITPSLDVQSLHKATENQVSQSPPDSGSNNTPTEDNFAQTSNMAKAYLSRVIQNNSPPAYPSTARQRRETGRVRIRVNLVTIKGELVRLESATVEDSSGSRILDEAGIQAVKSWNFPSFPIEETRRVSFLIPFEFTLVR